MRALLICMAFVMWGCTADTTSFSSTPALNQSPDGGYVDPDTGLPPDDGLNDGSGDPVTPPSDEVVVTPPTDDNPNTGSGDDVVVNPPPTDDNPNTGSGDDVVVNPPPPTDDSTGGDDVVANPPTDPNNGGDDGTGSDDDVVDNDNGGDNGGDEWARNCIIKMSAAAPRCDGRHAKANSGLVGNRSGQTNIGVVGVLALENISGRTYVEYAQRLDYMDNVSGNTYVNAGTAGPITNVSGELCLSARSIESYSNGSGRAILRAEEVGHIEFTSGRLDIYGAHVESISTHSGKICLYDGATVGTANVGKSGHIRNCK